MLDSMLDISIWLAFRCPYQTRPRVLGWGAPGWRGSKLEGSRLGLVTSLDLLVKGVTIWSYVHHHRHCLRPLQAIMQQFGEKVKLTISF